jgi:hypothetical protein
MPARDFCSVPEIALSTVVMALARLRCRRCCERAKWCSLVHEHRDSIPEGAGPAGQPSHILHRRCACPAPLPLHRRWEAVVDGT